MWIRSMVWVLRLRLRVKEIAKTKGFSSPGWFFPNQSALAASHLQPEVEHGTGDQQEEHSSYKAPGKDISLIEVTPGNKDGDNKSRYSDHLALQGDPYRTPACVKGDAAFTHTRERKQTTHDPCSQRRELPWPNKNHKIGLQEQQDTDEQGDQAYDGNDEPYRPWHDEVMGIWRARIGVPIAQPGEENQEWCGEVQDRPGKEREVAVIETLPVQQGRDAQQCGKCGDRKEADLDPVPACEGRSTHKKVGSAKVGRTK